MLIEKLTGMLFRDFVDEHILKAASMHNSGIDAINDLPENTANGYLEDRRTTNIYHLPLSGGGDGGMYTTTACFRSRVVIFLYLMHSQILALLRFEQRDKIAVFVNDGMISFNSPIITQQLQTSLLIS